MLNKNKVKFSVQDLISFYVENRMKKYRTDLEFYSVEQNRLEYENLINLTEERIYDSVKQEIIAKLSDEEYEKIKNDANNRFNSERTTNKLKHLIYMLIEGGLLAFIVGLLVNQITNWISICIAGEHELYWTIGISLILFILIIVIYLALFIKNIISFIENEDTHG